MTNQPILINYKSAFCPFYHHWGFDFYVLKMESKSKIINLWVYWLWISHLLERIYKIAYVIN